MSGGPITISIASDTKQFQSGVDDVAQSLEKVTAALDQTTSAGDKTGASIQQSMERAQQSTSNTSRTVEQGKTAWSDYRAAVLQSDDALQQSARAAEVAGTAAQVNGEKARTAGETIEEGSKLGEAAMMNVGFSAMQAGTLFTGGTQAIMEQAGTFAAFMGPALAGVEGTLGALAWPITIAGVAMAALGGIMTDTSKDATAATKAVQDFVNAFQDGAAGSDEFDRGIRAWAKDATDYGGTALNTLAEASQKSGQNFHDIAQSIISQNIPAMEKARDASNALAKQYADEANNTKNSWNGEEQAFIQKRDAANNVTGALKTQIDAVKQANEYEKVLAESMGLTVSQYKNYETAVQQAQTDQDNFNKSIQQGAQAASTATGDWAESTTVDLQQMLVNQQEYLNSLADFPNAIKTLTDEGLTGAGKEYLESLPNGAQLAEQIALDPNSSQAQSLVLQFNQLGTNAKKGLKDGISAGDLLDGVNVPVKADTSVAKSDIKKLADEKQTSTVTAKADTKTAESELKTVTEKKRTTTITAELDRTQFDRDMATVLRNRTITVTVNQRAGTKVP